jgi:hypothetical protein
MPRLCVESAADHVVRRRCLETILRLRPETKVATVRGGHFALHPAASAAAGAIAAFASAHAGAHPEAANDQLTRL